MEVDRTAAEVAAITHGSPLGWLPAAVLAHIISVGVYGDSSMTLREAVFEAWACVRGMYESRVKAEDLEVLGALIDAAVYLSMLDDEDDEAHISRLGAGWTGDEALAIALYCSLRHEHDFTAGIRAAVMHSGDSDSTGAITGNILGAWLGASAIDKAWLEPLELRAIIEILANDLLVGIPTKETDPYLGKVWRRRYIGGHLV